MSYYSGAHWTNHALDQLKNRGIPLADAVLAFNHPDTSHKGKNPNTWQYVKNMGNYSITTIGTQNEKKEWVVISCWRDPPLAGTKDYQKKIRHQAYVKAGFGGKIGYLLLDVLGL